MPAYRAIMLEPTVARMLSRAWRPKLVEGISKVAQPLQFGGRRGLGIEALHLQVRLWQSTAQHEKLSLGLIFIDIQAAFYSVIKPMLATVNGTADSLSQIFARLKLPDTAYQEFLQSVGSGQLIYEATGSRLLSDGTAATLSHTWFVVPQGTQVMAPTTGPRPGDPNADVLFSFIMAKLLKEIRHRASQEDLDLTEETEMGLVSRHLSWVDDLTFAVTSDAKSLTGKVAHLLSLIVDVATAHAVDHVLKGKLPVFTEHWGVMEIPVVTYYKHLGGHIIRGGAKLQEVRVRSAMAMQNVHPLKRVLVDKKLELHKRQYLLKSMGTSILTLHTGTWFALTLGECRAWQAAVFKLYQVLQGRDSDGEVEHMEYYQLAHEARGAMPMELMYIQRLRLFIHLLQNFDQFLIAAILHNHAVAAEDSWLYGVRQAIKWWQRQLGTECVPDELLEIDRWEGWYSFKDAASELKRMLKKAEKAHQIRISTICALKQHARKQDQMLQEIGWTKQQQEEVMRCKQHICEECDRGFDTQAALAVHQQRVHGQRMALRRFVTDGICRCCKKQFHTRPRLLRHLHWGQTKCWIYHCRSFEPMQEEQVQDMDNKDRSSGHAFHQHGLKNDESDQSWRWATPEELSPVLKMCRVVAMHIDEEPTQEELAQWAHYGMLTPGQGGREKTVRGRMDFTIAHVQHDTAAFEQRRCREVLEWSPNFDWVPRPLSHGQKYFLILFSGHRRIGDMASWFHWNTNIQPICIDRAIHEKHGNVMNEDHWMAMARARRLVGGHAGPPCETYSAARWLPTEGGIFPRSLRTSQDPWGCDYRQLHEVWQGHVGTILMLAAIRILTWIYVYGGSISLEHPRGEHDSPMKWSIWESGFLKQLLLAADAKLITFLQGPLGQNFPKPTTLFAARLPDLAPQIFSQYDLQWRPTETLGGKANGVWRTSKAKVYPEKLCRALA